MTYITSSEDDTARSNGDTCINSEKTLTILGCGALGTAILSGILAAKSTPSTSKTANPNNAGLKGVTPTGTLPSRFVACVRRPESADAIKKRLPTYINDSVVTILTCENLAGVQQADTILIAVQPHMLTALLDEPGIREALAGKLIISVLAGVTTAQITSQLGKNAISDDQVGRSYFVMRTMPNIACFVRDSTTVIEQPSAAIPTTFVELTERIFQCVGRVFDVEPSKFNVCTSLCGSTPAFFAVVLDSLVDGAVALGLNHVDALEMASHAMRGTANMALQGRQPTTIRYEVASPGGSTMQGLLALEHGRTRSTFANAIRASTDQNGRLASAADHN